MSANNPLSLEGSRIILRDWQEQDLEPWVEWHANQPLWRETDGPFFPDIPTDELKGEAEIRRKMIRASMYEDPRQSLIIASKETNQLIGTVTAYWRSKETLWLALGISLYDPTWWRKGVGQEAFSLWVDYQFAARPEIVRLGFETWSGNAGMMRLGEKMGFQLEARHRKARIVKGEYYDAVAYGILREEWPSKA